MKQYLYQWRVLGLMILAWSFVGLVHNCVSFLFPYFSVEFEIGSQHNGYLTGILAFFWTLSILYCGPKANKKGQLHVMLPMLALAAIALGAMMLSKNIIMLYVLIAVAGFGCGSVVPTSLSFLAEQSNPKNRGAFFGIAQASYTLVGSAIGSVIFTRLAATSVGWRGCYFLLSVLVLSAVIIIYFAGRKIPRADEERDNKKKQNFCQLLAYKNVLLSTVLAICVMMWYFTVAAFTILYLMEAKNLSIIESGAIFAGFGVGGFIGEFATPILSDYVGRKKTVLFAVILGTLCFASFLFLELSSMLMTLSIAGASLCMSGAMPILNSVIPSESVPKEFVALATSFTSAAGELVGGVVSPVIFGLLSSIFSMTLLMNTLILLPVFVIVGACFLKETAPLKTK